MGEVWVMKVTVTLKIISRIIADLHEKDSAITMIGSMVKMVNITRETFKT